MYDSDTLKAARDAATTWAAGYDKIVKRFDDVAAERAQAPRTNSGLPLESAYFPSDVADLSYVEDAAQRLERRPIREMRAALSTLTLAG